MAKRASFPEGTIQKMENLLRASLSGPELRRVQSVLLGAQGMSSPAISSIVGYTPEHIRLIWRAFRSEGEQCLLGEKRGSGRGKAYLTLEEEKQFLAPFIGQAKESGMLIVSELHKAHKERLGKEKLHHSVTYNLLHRHGWRKILPRPSHPKADAKARKAFRDSFSPEGRKSTAQGKNKTLELQGRVPG